VGSSTLFKRLKERFPSYKHTSVGDEMRKIQKQYGFATIEEFVAHLKTHPEVRCDDYCDNQIRLLCENDHVFVDGRIVHMYSRGFRIKLVCPILTCAERRQKQILENTGERVPFKKVLKALLERNFIDFERWRDTRPGYDWPDDQFDVIVDTGVWGKEDVERIVIEEHAIWLKQMLEQRRVLRLRQEIIDIPLPQTSAENQMRALA
jgi:cytidylate kinase